MPHNQTCESTGLNMIMKRAPIFLILLVLWMAGCDDREYSRIQNEDLGEVFILNSSPTFHGYYYEGSDKKFHYFTCRWKHRGEQKVKVAKSDLKIAREFDFSNGEIALTVLNLANSAPAFCEIEGRPIYVKEPTSQQ